MDGSQGDIGTEDGGTLDVTLRFKNNPLINSPQDGVIFLPDPSGDGPHALENSAIELQDKEGESLPSAGNKNIPFNSPWLYGDEEEVDAITKAIRERVLEPQWAWLARHFPDEKLEDFDSRAKFLKDEKNQQAINQCFRDPEGKFTLEELELAGYNYVRDKFQKDFETIEWQKTGPTEIKDPGTDKPIITLRYSEVRPSSMQARKLDGTVVEIKAHREIQGIETSLKPPENVSAPVILSLDLMDEHGEYLSKNNNPLRVTLHYNSRGELIEFSAPRPMQFNSKDPKEMGYFEHRGKIITTGIPQAKYQELLLAVEKKKGHAFDVSEVVEPGLGIERQQQPKDVVSSLEEDKINLDKGLRDTQVPDPAIEEKLAKIIQAAQATHLNPPAPDKSTQEILAGAKSALPYERLSQVLAAHNVGIQTESELIAKQLASQSEEERRSTIGRLTKLGFSVPLEAQDKDVGLAGVSNSPGIKQPIQDERQRRIIEKYQEQDGKSTGNQLASDIDKNPASQSAESSANSRIGGDTPKLANGKEHGAIRQAGHGDSHQLADQVRDKLEHQKKSLSPLGDHSNKGMMEKDPETKAKAL
ncbi:Sca4 family protein [Candidatus Tisiphia endosymbiont of Nemotelus uliginosus]|uniref:Sca4 family protein n=1 Tax=Candidatus Tisiphia endosymbiont of Nemotelus uliginosus TaxID=3077926 RepID=UPI0035C93083